MDNNYRIAKILRRITGKNFQKEKEPLQIIDLTPDSKEFSKQYDPKLAQLRNKIPSLEENKFVQYQKEKSAGSLLSPPYIPKSPGEILKLSPPSAAIVKSEQEQEETA